jgi:CHAD domain-containing protein
MLRQRCGVLQSQSPARPAVKMMIRRPVDRFRDDYRRAHKRLPAHISKVPPDELHQFRKAVAVHRYQLELVLPNETGRVAAMDAVRRRLGNAQDLEMLRADVEKHPRSDARERLTALIARRQRKHRRKAIRAARAVLGRPTFHAWPKETAFYSHGESGSATCA